MTCLMRHLLQMLSNFGRYLLFLFRTPMHYAAYNGHVEALKVLVENGANHELLDDQGKTPHYYAMLQGEYDAADYLSTL